MVSFLISINVWSLFTCYHTYLKSQYDISAPPALFFCFIQEEMKAIKSWHSLATQAHRSTSVSSTIDRDVELSASLLAPVIPGNLSSASSVAITLPSVVSSSSGGQVPPIPYLLPELNKPTMSLGTCSLGTPPQSNCTTIVSSQDSKSLQLSSGNFLFGLPTSLSKPFNFNISSSSLGAIPLCVESTSAEFTPSLTTSAKVDDSSSDGIPPKSISASSHKGTATTSSLNVQFFRALPLHSVQLPSDATMTISSTANAVSTFHETRRAGSHITSSIGATPPLETPPQFASTSKFQSASISNMPRTISTSKLDGKQLSVGPVLTWTPQYTTQVSTSATADPSQILLPDTRSQSKTSSLHPMLLSSSSSSVDPANMPLYDDLVAFSPEAFSEAVTDDASTSARESSPVFEPLVSLPLIEELNSGEEDEKVLFCNRAKLYRFDNCQWKERGVGNMKILKHQISGKARLLMRRDQILKLCCNHFISGNMSITEMKGSSELAWCTNCDFSDGVSKPETFAIKFKYRETGSVFKQIFEECALSNCKSDNTSEEISIPGSAVSIKQTSTSLDKTASLSRNKASFLDSLSVTNTTSSCDTCSVQDEAEYGSTKPVSEDSPSHTQPSDQSDGKQGEVILTEVEMPSDDKIKVSRHLMLPDTFFNYENKPPCPGCRGCIDQIGKIDGTHLVSQDQECELNYHSCDQSTSLDVFGSTSKFSVADFAELAASESSSTPFSQLHYSSPLHAFSGAGEALFEKHVERVDDLGADGAHFKALVSLPEIDVKTGEESEEVLFTNRAKLFRFDATVSQWKERGIGDIKLLRNVHTNKVRILMRRDQILKVCCNHFITSDMSLLAYQERSVMWFTLNDFADEVPRPEKFAVKFKSAEIVQMFKQVFESCVSRCKSDIPVETTKKVDTNTSDINLKEQFAPEPGSWICSICSVCNPESVTLCLACQSSKPGLNKLLSPQNSAAILKDLHICSPTEIDGNRNTRGFQLPLNITLPTSSRTSTSTTKSMTTVSLSPRLTSPSLHIPDSLMSINEKEEVTFSARGILYVEDLCTKQWDIGSHGEMKVIKNKFSREKRLLMISKDHESALCSHGITSIMHLKPHAQKERAWTWNGFDNSRSTPTKSAVQKYCIEFHSEDDALRFKNSFETSFSLSTDGANDEVGCNELSVEVTFGDKQPEILSESDDDDVIFICEEDPEPSLIKKAEELLLPKSFYLYEKKPPCSGCRGCDDDVQHTSCGVTKPTPFSEPESASNYSHCDEVSTTIGFSSAGMPSFTDLISKEKTSVSTFPKVGFQFDGAGRQLFSPNLNAPGFEAEAEAEIDFAPLVSLPETYRMKSWDEDAKVLFIQRAKLYRFDGNVKQWKERGIGDMKILQHPETKKVYLIMRRDQILKLCCNHYLTENMQLMQLETEKLWMWFTPSDFSGDKPQPEQFAIRFKCAERGIEFKKVFDECVAQLRSTAKPIYPQPTMKDIALNNPDVDSWECPQCLVRNKNEHCKCAACGYINPGGSNLGGVNISSLESIPTLSNTEPCSSDTGSAVGEFNIPLLQEVHLSSSTSLIPVQTSLPSDSMTPITATTSSNFHTTPILQSLADEALPDQTDQTLHNTVGDTRKM